MNKSILFMVGAVALGVAGMATSASAASPTVGFIYDSAANPGGPFDTSNNIGTIVDTTDAPGLAPYQFDFTLNGPQTFTLQMQAADSQNLAQNIGYEVFTSGGVQVFSTGGLIASGDVSQLSLAGGDYYVQISSSEIAAKGEDIYGTLVIVPGAPEPATWSLMILGVGGMGAALRSRRKAVIA